ncbi:MAG: PQQ-binding-like beta-propeller repeat protein [Candidatus Hydrogenedentes bacterium]|nr:PQQ-binding-like beta-propeller repeat protein [Candidatus Hydrogenedentota bacterium]
MLFRTCCLLILALSLGFSTAHADWPTYRHDMARSGIASDALGTHLEEAWVHKPTHPPKPAWPGPARRDGWHKSDPLKARMIFDWAFHVVMDDDTLYFGSSSDDKIYGIDLATGEETWSFFTGGPVRLAPTVANGKVYAGSDDGYVYCLDSAKGEQVWRHQVAPDSYLLPGNSRVISISPVRTGVLVDNSMAYFGSGVFTFEGAYLCAADAETGKPIWKKKINNTAQGYMLASADSLYVARARVNPLVLSRDEGKVKYSHSGGGGSFSVLVDDYLFYGPGKTGQIEVSRSDKSRHLVTFQGNVLVVDGSIAYMQSDTELQSLDRGRYLALAEERKKIEVKKDLTKNKLKGLQKKADKTDDDKAKMDELVAKIEGFDKAMAPYAGKMEACMRWKAPSAYPYSLILAGERLYAGGLNEVAAINPKDGSVTWTAPVQGRALELASANGYLLVSTDEGAIHCFKDAAPKIALRTK